MGTSVHQVIFNKSVVTAILFNNLTLNEKEQKLQLFINEAEERYDMLCDNVYNLISNKEKNTGADTLYLTIDGFSFVSSSLTGHETSCFPVLTINQYSPVCSDVSILIEIALNQFASFCEFIKTTINSFTKTA